MEDGLSGSRDGSGGGCGDGSDGYGEWVELRLGMGQVKMVGDGSDGGGNKSGNDEWWVVWW